jgi:hypothetical protein
MPLLQVEWSYSGPGRKERPGYTLIPVERLIPILPVRRQQVVRQGWCAATTPWRRKGSEPSTMAVEAEEEFVETGPVKASVDGDRV